MANQNTKSEVIVIQPDTHIPYHHVNATNAFLEFIADVQPNRIIQIGDLFDCLAIARWTTGTREESGALLQGEIDAGDRWLASLRDVYDGSYEFFTGNHEDRLEKYLRIKGQGLEGLRCLTIPELFNFSQHKIKAVTQPHPVAPNVVAVHGSVIRKFAGYSVKAEMEKRGQSIIMGHTHRMSLYYETQGPRHLWGMEAGHLADQEQMAYLGHGTPANWQMGFAVLYRDGQHIHPVLVRMDRKGRFTFHGVRYGF